MAFYYEYYDGLHLYSDAMQTTEVSLQKEYDLDEVIRGMSGVEFSLMSRFGGELSFESFKEFPETLKKLTLPHYGGVSKDVIERLIAQDVECHHEKEEYWEDDGLVMMDDTKTYSLINFKWCTV